MAIRLTPSYRDSTVNIDPNNPFHVLAFQVLLRALRDIAGIVESTSITDGGGRNQIKREALSWLLANDLSKDNLSFNLICEALEINKTKLRKSVLADPESFVYNLEQALLQNKKRDLKVPDDIKSKGRAGTRRANKNFNKTKRAQIVFRSVGKKNY